MSDADTVITGPEEAVRLLEEFLAAVESFYGSFLDTYTALRHFRMLLEERALPTMLAHGVDARVKDAEEPVILFGTGDPNEPGSSFHHRSTLPEFLERVRDGGTDLALISQAYVVLIYQCWEDHYRGKIAQAVGMPKGKLVFPLMGDVRHIRRSIIHNGGVAITDIEKCEVFKVFSPGDTISLEGDRFNELVTGIRQAVGGAIEAFREPTGWKE